jgi:7-keto-8-aminopelargonate synthetase-like enzyme
MDKICDMAEKYDALVMVDESPLGRCGGLPGVGTV